MNAITIALCPKTNKEVNPVALIPVDWKDSKPPVITCPICGEPHQWRPLKGTLVSLIDEREDDRLEAQS